MATRLRTSSLLIFSALVVEVAECQQTLPFFHLGVAEGSKLQAWPRTDCLHGSNLIVAVADITIGDQLQ